MIFDILCSFRTKTLCWVFNKKLFEIKDIKFVEEFAYVKNNVFCISRDWNLRSKSNLFLFDHFVNEFIILISIVKWRNADDHFVSIIIIIQTIGLTRLAT